MCVWGGGLNNVSVYSPRAIDRCVCGGGLNNVSVYPPRAIDRCVGGGGGTEQRQCVSTTCHRQVCVWGGGTEQRQCVFTTCHRQGVLLVDGE